MSYYDGIALLSLLALGVLAAIVAENGRLDKTKKKTLYLTYGMIALANFSEWAAIVLNGAPVGAVMLHKLAKFADYVLSPASMLFFCRQISTDKGKEQFMWYLFWINFVVEALSIFTGWTFYVDAANVYHHGSLHLIYVGVYVCNIIYGTYCFIQYGKNFRRQNRISLFLIVLFLIIGIALQEAVSTDIRSICITLSMICVFILLHTTEFSSVITEEHLAEQQKLLEHEPLTGLCSRYYYTERMEELNKLTVLPEDLIVFSIDINGLKTTNDTMGHAAGDELIRGAAECMREVLEPYGNIFRTGGDEFIAFLKMDEKTAAEKVAELKTVCEHWSGTVVKTLSLSVGYAAAAGRQYLKFEKLVILADREMYKDKHEYYITSGLDRRHSS